MSRAWAAKESTVFPADSGDNVTADAPGDLSLVVRRRVERKVKSAVVAGINDAPAVNRCFEPGGVVLAPVEDRRVIHPTTVAETRRDTLLDDRQAHRLLARCRQNGPRRAHHQCCCNNWAHHASIHGLPPGGTDDDLVGDLYLLDAFIVEEDSERTRPAGLVGQFPAFVAAADLDFVEAEGSVPRAVDVDVAVVVEDSHRSLGRRAVAPIVDREDAHALALGGGPAAVAVVLHREAVVLRPEPWVDLLPHRSDGRVLGAIHHDETRLERGDASLEIVRVARRSIVVQEQLRKERLSRVVPLAVAVHHAEAAQGR
ncbi:MAG: hypothetical protein GX448_19415, partial [Planctomycetes bacterium]|nr:hypothetical protein [Planctomycetota bacterium]